MVPRNREKELVHGSDPERPRQGQGKRKTDEDGGKKDSARDFTYAEKDEGKARRQSRDRDSTRRTTKPRRLGQFGPHYGDLLETSVPRTSFVGGGGAIVIRLRELAPCRRVGREIERVSERYAHGGEEDRTVRWRL